MRSKREGTSYRSRLMPIAALVTATIVFAVWALVFHHHNLAVFIVGHYAETLALLPALTMLGLLSVVVTIDAYIRPDLKRTMRLIIAVVFSVVIRDHLEYRLMIGEPRPQLRTLVAIYGYVVRPVVLVLFMRMIVSQKRLWWAWALVGVNATIYLTALFSDVCFYISHDNHYIGGPLSDTAFYIGAILFICYIVMTIRVFEPKTRRETWLPVLMFELIIGALALDFNTYDFDYPITYLTIAVVIDCVINYIWLHLQFVREHEEALQAEQRIQIMMTQIQPHFLYNTLSTIQALCRIDPEKAFTITERFGTYLRQNIDSLSQPNLIPVKKELEHTKIYSDIESVRFDNITVVYDTPETGFSVPALTIQPLVENAIRHGVRTREKGIVCISTAKADGGYEIVIEDNGKGFDTALTEKTDGTHIGISNVRERLHSMCGGTMKLESTKDIGTKITICIPR